MCILYRVKVFSNKPDLVPFFLLFVSFLMAMAAGNKLVRAGRGDGSEALLMGFSHGSLIWRRSHPLLFLLEATMGVVEEMVKGGKMNSADGFGAHQQWRFSWWNYGAGGLPVFNRAPLPQLVEGRPYNSFQPECYKGGSSSFFSEFMARCRCREGLDAPSGLSPAVVRLDLGGSWCGPNCNSIFQCRVLLVKGRGLCSIFPLAEFLCALCDVTVLI